MMPFAILCAGLGGALLLMLWPFPAYVIFWMGHLALEAGFFLIGMSLHAAAWAVGKTRSILEK